MSIEVSEIEISAGEHALTIPDDVLDQVGPVVVMAPGMSTETTCVILRGNEVIEDITAYSPNYKPTSNLAKMVFFSVLDGDKTKGEVLYGDQRVVITIPIKLREE